MKCYICDNGIKKSQAHFGDIGTPLEGRPLCEYCYYDAETCAIVYYGRNETPYLISETRNETEGNFSVKWRRIDP